MGDSLVLNGVGIGIFYVCGPPPMTQDTLGTLGRLGIPGSRIHYEQWWRA